ncbi:hypothetical protein B0H16DRAFT_1726939 [Mycena metata]|uniref:Uncharacterized protein n=1 Tax=Mycena metata TaxID=1033252 RepID=A0AAD7IND5_9AGAR|nr:hypothetical protein B0H16DRAFT_1726939 [Mycena metata]
MTVATYHDRYIQVLLHPPPHLRFPALHPRRHAHRHICHPAVVIASALHDCTNSLKSKSKKVPGGVKRATTDGKENAPYPASSGRSRAGTPYGERPHSMARVRRRPGFGAWDRIDSSRYDYLSCLHDASRSRNLTFSFFYKPDQYRAADYSSINPIHCFDLTRKIIVPPR